jgi:hypothetical protein
MNWGARIAMLYIGFVGLIVALVWGSMRQSFDLVSGDYYQEELKYQDVIEAGKNQAALSAPVAIQQDAASVSLILPKDLADKTISGSAHFYSAVNKEWDKEFALNGSNVFTFSKADLHKTNYQLKLKWKVDGKDYYQENTVSIN